MNFKRLVDGLRVRHMLAILDAKYEQKVCIGTRDRALKQQIPTRLKARSYAKNADPARYEAYLRHQPGCKTPHFTGMYYCPYCDCWHVTTSDIPSPQAFERVWRDNTAEAIHNGEDCFNAPEGDETYTEVFNFPDYTPEELEEVHKRFAKFNNAKGTSK